MRRNFKRLIVYGKNLKLQRKPTKSFTALMEGKINKQLRKVLKKIVKETHEPLAVADAKLGGVIKEKLSVVSIVLSLMNL